MRIWRIVFRILGGHPQWLVRVVANKLGVRPNWLMPSGKYSHSFTLCNPEGEIIGRLDCDSRGHVLKRELKGKQV